MGEIFERIVPGAPLEWTGERLTTAVAGQVEIEHLHRYFVARTYCRGLDVLDIACGEGYGSSLMAQTARSVIGVDVSAETVAHAAQSYVRSNLRYEQGDARKILLPDHSVDMVVSFETLEHFFEHDIFMEEVRRVLRPGGLLLISSPERDIYSPAGSAANPYHVNELCRLEFDHLLRRYFGHVQILSQRPLLGSALVNEDGAEVAGALTFEKRGAQHYEVNNGLPRPVYHVAMASDAPRPPVRHSLYIETDQIQHLTAMPSLQAELSRNIAARQELEIQCQKLTEKVELYERVGLAQQIAGSAEQNAGYSTAARNSFMESEVDTLRHQLDLLRQALRKHATGNSLAAEAWRQRAMEAEAQAAEWRQRYEALRARLVQIMHRFQIHIVAKATPKVLKRFARERLLGGPRS